MTPIDLIATVARNGPPRPTLTPTDAGGEIPWGDPAPLPTMPAVPPFPIGVFPEAIRTYWRAAAESLGCPVDYVAVPGMTLLGVAVGRSRAAEVKHGYAESPLFWTATFAPPGSVKSPALRAARGPLQAAEARWMDEHKEAMNEYGVEADRHAAAVKEWKADGCVGDPPAKPDKPALRQATLDDTTVEATARVLADNPRGVGVVKDELVGFVKSLNQYRGGGKGADREFWLSAWAGAAVKVNRAGNHDAGPLVVAHPFVAIAGMLCPDSLAELRGEGRGGEAQADGFLDRFLLAFPDPVEATAETWRTVPGHVERGYGEVFEHLLGMEPAGGGTTGAKEYPVFVPFSADGRAAWEEFTGDLAAKMNTLDGFDPFRGVLSKLRGYGLRFCCLLWCLRRATGKTADADPIGADVVAGASSLVDYFERHAVRCLGRGWADRTSRIAHRLLAWLSRHPERKGFTRTEAFIAMKDKRDVRSSESLTPAFRLLADHNYVRPLDRTAGTRPGPAPETYVVNANFKRPTSESDP